MIHTICTMHEQMAQGIKHLSISCSGCTATLNAGKCCSGQDMPN